MKNILKIAALAITLFSSVHALENADVAKLVADLKSDNPQVRANAVTQLTPLYVELEQSFRRLRNDKDPNVILAFQAFSDKMMGVIRKTPEGLDAQAKVNEVVAVACCRSYCTAQDIYKLTDHNKDGVLEYAQALKGDLSLFENKAGAADVAMIDISFANAEGNPGKATPKSGYCFKVLMKQGANAVGGAKSYIKDGHMIDGYALLAYPAEYGVTGKSCFVVGSSGVKDSKGQIGYIFQKDFGSTTLDIVKGFDEFNPDKTWIITE